MAVPIYIPPTVYKGCIFNAFFHNLFSPLPFDDGHSNRCEAISHGGFDWHSQDG